MYGPTRVMAGVTRDWRSVRRGAYVWLSMAPGAAGAMQRAHVEGRVRTALADRLILVTEPERLRLRVAVTGIDGVWVRRGGTLQSGLQLAAICGATGLGAAARGQEEDERRGEFVIGPPPAVFAVLGALMGWSMGISRPRVWWERVRLPTPPGAERRGRL